MNPYYTHQEFLKKELENLTDKCTVLELGIGYGSTPLMLEFLKTNSNAKVIAFESNKKWYDDISEKFKHPNYDFRFINNWDELPKFDRTIDLAFIDQSPWQARIDSINLLKDVTKTFIVHDYDYFNRDYTSKLINNDNSWWGPAYSNEFILEDNYKLLPPTLIMRNKQI